MIQGKRCLLCLEGFKCICLNRDPASYPAVFMCGQDSGCDTFAPAANEASLPIATFSF